MVLRAAFATGVAICCRSGASSPARLRRRSEPALRSARPASGFPESATSKYSTRASGCRANIAKAACRSTAVDCSPCSINPAAARSAHDSTGAILRSSAVRCLLRELSASPSSSRTVGDGHHCNRNVQIRNHPPDDRQLLRILLAKVGPVGFHDVEQLEHDRRHAAEMSGRCAPQRCALSAGDSTKVSCSRG